MSFRGEEQPRRAGHEETGEPVPAGERGRRRSSRVPLLLLLVLLLIVVLMVGVILLLRSLGESVSGTSVARDSLDSGPEPHVRLVNGAGQVSVEGVKDLKAVEYEVIRYARGPDPAAAKNNASEIPVDFSREDSTLILRTDGGRDTGADYALRVPAGSAMEIESEAGDVEVTGLSGHVTVKAEAGDVEVRGSGGSVTIESPGGDVTLSGMNTETGQAELTVGSGDVALEDLVLGTLEAGVEAGDVAFSGRFSGGGRVVVETGSIAARIPPEDTTDLDLEARVGEVVRESAPDDAPEGSGEGSGQESGGEGQ